MQQLGIYIKISEEGFIKFFDDAGLVSSHGDCEPEYFTDSALRVIFNQILNKVCEDEESKIFENWEDYTQDISKKYIEMTAYDICDEYLAYDDLAVFDDDIVDMAEDYLRSKNVSFQEIRKANSYLIERDSLD